MKKIFLFLIIFFGFMFSAKASLAASYYVNKDAKGANNGTSWTDAWKEMNQINMSTVAGANTVYIAGGNYTTMLNITASGINDSSRLIFKKATVADHGSDTGWSATYDAVVDIDSTSNNAINLNGKSYITIDGANRYGFHLKGGTGYGTVFSSDTASFVTLRYLWVDGTAHPQGYTEDGIYAPLVDSIIEYCNVDGYYDGGRHGDAISGTWTRVTLRYSHLGRSLQYMSFYSTTDVRVYGNLFYKSPSSNTTHAIQTNASSGSNLFYNNVLNCNKAGWPYSDYPSFIVGSYTGWVSKNNAFIDCTGYPSGDHNAYSGGGTAPTGEAGKIVATDLGFTAISAGDYTLKSTSPLVGSGVNLGSPYNQDFSGNTRPGTAAWSIGAYEYGGTAPVNTAPAAPMGVKVI